MVVINSAPTTTTSVPATTTTVYNYRTVTLTIKPVPYTFSARLDFYDNTRFIGSVPVVIRAGETNKVVSVNSLGMTSNANRGLYVIFNSPLVRGSRKIYLREGVSGATTGTTTTIPTLCSRDADCPDAYYCPHFNCPSGVTCDTICVRRPGT